MSDDELGPHRSLPPPPPLTPRQLRAMAIAAIETAPDDMLPSLTDPILDALIPEQRRAVAIAAFQTATPGAATVLYEAMLLIMADDLRAARLSETTP